jgi:cyclohexa-1,5-dienecarbonyl-CoA hydratase
MSDLVRVDRIGHGAVLRIVLAGEKGNVLTSALLSELDAALAAHASDAHLKLVLFEGSGKHFSFGASVEEHRKDRVRAMLRTFHGVVLRVLSYPVATAALVRGRCLGGAFELALACNFVIAADDASFACPEISLGVFPPVLAALGPSRLGATWTDRLVLTGQSLDARTAEAIGLVTARAPAGVDLLEHAMDWYAASLEKHSAFALRQALDATRKGSGMIERAERTLADLEKLYLERVVSSADGNEGIEAFLAKRPPQWVDA